MLLQALLHRAASNQRSVTFSQLEGLGAELEIVNELDVFGFQATLLSTHLEQVLGIFLGFQALGFVLVPLPVMLLGTVVIIVQAVVFTLLTIVYISMAVEEHDDHEGGAAH